MARKKSVVGEETVIVTVIHAGDVDNFIQRIIENMKTSNLKKGSIKKTLQNIDITDKVYQHLETTRNQNNVKILVITNKLLRQLEKNPLEQVTINDTDCIMCLLFGVSPHKLKSCPLKGLGNFESYRHRQMDCSVSNNNVNELLSECEHMVTHSSKFSFASNFIYEQLNQSPSEVFLVFKAGFLKETSRKSLSIQIFQDYNNKCAITSYEIINGYNIRFKLPAAFEERTGYITVEIKYKQKHLGYEEFKFISCRQSPVHSPTVSSLESFQTPTRENSFRYCRKEVFQGELAGAITRRKLEQKSSNASSSYDYLSVYRDQSSQDCPCSSIGLSYSRNLSRSTDISDKSTDISYNSEYENLVVCKMVVPNMRDQPDINEAISHSDDMVNTGLTEQKYEVEMEKGEYIYYTKASYNSKGRL